MSQLQSDVSAKSKGRKLPANVTAKTAKKKTSKKKTSSNPKADAGRGVPKSDSTAQAAQPELLPGSTDALYLVDVSSFIFRAFYAVRALNNTRGEPTNAVFGVATMLAKLVEDANPENLVIVYDSKEPSFRKEVYAEYKANRSEPPDDLKPQFARIEQLIKAMGFPSVRKSGVEADDLIATLTQSWLKVGKDKNVVIVTGDKDLMQLIEKRVCVWDTMKDKIFRDAGVVEKFGVRPNQIRDYLAMVGDTSDNVPGIPSIGPKSATQLLGEFETLEGVIQAAKDGKIKGKKSDVILDNLDQAKLSQDLVSLKSDCEVDLSEKDYGFSFSLSDDARNLLKELEFKVLLTRWEERYGRGTSSKETEAALVQEKIETAKKDFDFRAVFEKSELEALAKELEGSAEFGFDLETTSLNPREAEIVGVAIGADDTRGYYIPVGHRSDSKKQLDLKVVLDRLKPILENPKIKKIGQNLKYDWSVLQANGIEPDGIGADTMVASFVIDPTGRHNLDAISTKYLGHTPISYEEICGKGKSQIGFDQVPVEQATQYAAEDAVLAVRLWRVLKPKLEEAKLMQVFATVEMPLVEILARIEKEGVSIDSDYLAKLSKKFEKEIAVLDKKVQAFSKEPLNLNSTRQIGHLLFDELGLPVQKKTKTGYSTDAKVLDALKDMHEVPKLLVEYREISKLKSTYVDPLPTLVEKGSGRLHGSFHQTVAATGRLSSSDPNLQNIPIRTDRGKDIRRAFVPKKGNELLSADYSQIELRILAHMSEDPDLLESFQTDQDVHRRTAAELFDCKPDEVKDEQRGIAKAINFGLMYGKTAFGLAQELKISRTEAKQIIEKYFKRYFKVKEFLDSLIEDAKETGYAITMMGRKRPLPEINSKNPMLRGVGERMAMNTPIQGTAAELMKLAMIDTDKMLRDGKYESKMIIQVHDELVLECPKSEAEEVEAKLVSSMENAMKMKVPLKVNSERGECWADL